MLAKIVILIFSENFFSKSYFLGEYAPLCIIFVLVNIALVLFTPPVLFTPQYPTVIKSNILIFDLSHNCRNKKGQEAALKVE